MEKVNILMKLRYSETSSENFGKFIGKVPWQMRGNYRNHA